MGVDWLGLPDHLTVLMADKLSRCDFIRFSAVCKSWNSVNNAHSRHSLPHRLPLLLIPNSTTNKDDLDRKNYAHTFYEFHEKRMYHFKVLVPCQMKYKGSSHGCLILVWNWTQRKEVYVGISYPLTADHKDIVLPPLRGESYYDIKKVVLSANPSANHNYTVMVVFMNYVHHRLAFFNPAAGRHWTYIDQSFGKINDIFYYNKNQQFYFVKDSGMVFACDLDNPNDPKVLPVLAAPVPVPPPYFSFRERDNNLDKYLYLVELSSGELLLIEKYVCRVELSSGGSRSCINGFAAYMMNPLVEPEWIEMHNLCGDTIFLSDYSSLSVRASDFCECKPNCIYFTDYWYLNKDSDEWTGANHIGVFNLEEGIIEERYPLEARSRVWRIPIWMEPSQPTVPRHVD